MTESRASELERKRRDKSTRFFLTGGTGFLGSHIAAELLRRGYHISLLARGDGQHTAGERIARLLDWHGVPASAHSQVRVIEGDITRPGLGIDPAIRSDILKTTDEIIHCASNTAFSSRKRPLVEAVNTAGLANVLDFARTGPAFFHHVSTAFVAGKVTGRCLEEPVTGREFNNVYEETKCLGESAVIAASREAGFGLTIYRPTIVYGDSRTGRSLLFNAVYHPVRMALFIRDLCEKDIREGDGRQAAGMGVSIAPDGTTTLPLRIEVAPGGGINIIPVDFFTSAFMALLEGAPEGGIFHIASDKLQPIEDFIEYSARLFHLQGVRACLPADFTTDPRNTLEALYDHYVGAYGPYMRDTRTFDSTRSRPILDRVGVVCPDFNYDVFSRCMGFAIEANWGARLFPN